MKYTESENKAFDQYNNDFANPFLSEDYKNYDFQKRIGGDYGDFTLVGRNKLPTRQNCGSFRALYGCLNLSAHGKTVDGEDYTGLVPVFPVYHTCHRPDCPVCYAHGWARREALIMTDRLKQFSHGFVDERGRRSVPRGKIEHIVDSIPPQDYGLSFDALRRKTVKVLAARGVIGGSMMFHGFRYANRDEARIFNVPFGWRWSPHFHILGFIQDGFSKCRKCPFLDVDDRYRVPCTNCCGFYGRSKRLYKKDKHIVKVLGERQTIIGTAWYQLGHATIRKSKRGHAVFWFGVCSRRRYKPEKTKKEVHKCPICNEPLVKLRYLGKKRIIVDREHPDFKSCILMPYNEDGSFVFVEDSERPFG